MTWIEEFFQEKLAELDGDKQTAALLTVAEAIREVASAIDRATGDEETLYGALVAAGRTLKGER